MLNKIMRQKVALCLDQPFFGVLMMRLKVREVAKGVLPCDTMATDGVNLFFVADYIRDMPDAKLKGLLAHEVMHNALLHHTRRKQRTPKKWNLACDAAIDHILKDAGFDVPDSFADMPQWAWAKGKSAETIYHEMPPQPPGGTRPGGVLDAPKDVREEDMKVALQQAAMAQKSHDRRKGKHTAWLKAFVDEQCQPKVPWQDVLRRFFSPLVPNDYTWARPNRRFVHQSLYLPGTLKGGIGEGVVFFDSSGSCMQDWPQFAGELAAIFNDVVPERVHVVMCDSSVKNIQTIEAGEVFEPNVFGGGGSDFRPAFQAVANTDWPIKWAVVLSDMIIDFPEEAPPYPVIAVSTTTHTGPVWAQQLKLEH